MSGGTISTAVIASSSASPTTWCGMNASSSNAHNFSSRVLGLVARAREHQGRLLGGECLLHEFAHQQQIGSSRKRGLSIR